jgi:8-oxo-dGTP pyrophosphatase MutT (NUDIX family)
MKDDFILHLEEKLSDTLPGQEAQYRMAHQVRRRVAPPPSNARMAGVLALFYPKASDWHLVFIQRPHHPEDRHSGQISFPGGKMEDSDNDLSETAIREAEEEIGVAASSIELLGPLTELYIPVSNFLVSPYVGYVDAPPVFRPEPGEVESILEVPFHKFLQRETRQKINLEITEQITLREVPYFNVEGKVIWGATAMILNELVELGAAQ